MRAPSLLTLARTAALALVLALLPAAALAGPAEIADDWPRALREAKARDLPVLADVWAPWCHTCRFMRAEVLPEVRRSPAGRRFVWLSIDAESAKNAAFLSRFPVSSFPTYLVVDPGARPLWRWTGSASATELAAALDDVRRERAGGRSRGADAAVAGAVRAEAAGDFQAALAGYRAALERGGPSWQGRARTTERLVLAAATARALRPCAEEAAARAAALPRGRSFANVVGTGLGCALEAEDEAWSPPAREQLEPLAREAAELPGLLADDRAGLLDALADAREASGDAEGARATAERCWAFLEEAARDAPTPEARAALDGPRVNTALRLGDPARALPEIEASQRDLPQDGNPPARKARLLLALGQLEAARAAAERALALFYGPRKLDVYALLAEVEAKAGRPEAQAHALDEALAYEARLPAPQRRPAKAEALRKARLALGGT